VQQVVGVLPGNIDADQEMHLAMACGDLLQTLAELGIAGAGFGERQFVGGRLKVVAQECRVVAVACGVNADADPDGCIVDRRGR
jgi:hypothetical protein